MTVTSASMAHCRGHGFIVCQRQSDGACLGQTQGSERFGQHALGNLFYRGGVVSSSFLTDVLLPTINGFYSEVNFLPGQEGRPTVAQQHGVIRAVASGGHLFRPRPAIAVISKLSPTAANDYPPRLRDGLRRNQAISWPLIYASGNCAIVLRKLSSTSARAF